MNNIEIKVGQKYRIIDGDAFNSCRYGAGDVLVVDHVYNEEGYEKSGVTFIMPRDIMEGIVELAEDNPEGITTQIPPVGTKCLYSFGGTVWWECEVIAQERPVIYCPHIDNIQVVDEEQCDVFYKPLPEEKPKSTAQTRMEEIEKRMRELADELRELSDE